MTAVLVLLVVAVVGGVIWSNANRSADLMLAESERQMIQTGETVTERIRLLFDPIYAIVGLGTEVSDLTAPLKPDEAAAGTYPGLPLMLRGLQIYPQILSFYVGFNNGDFVMLTHLAGDKAESLRTALDAPHDTAFAKEVIVATPGGGRLVRWSFLAKDGSVIDARNPVAAEFDPRQRPWYVAALNSDDVAQSGLYVFASSGEPGFTLSRQFGGQTKGVIGADIAASQVAEFLREQKITPSSKAYIFTASGEVVALSDANAMAAITKSVKPNAMIAPTKIADLGDPLLSRVFAEYKTPLTSVHNIDGKSYVGRVIEIPPRYGRDQLLAVLVPVDEIEQPVIGLRNEALFYSILILLFALPLYVTLCVAWIDRRLLASGPDDD